MYGKYQKHFQNLSYEHIYVGIHILHTLFNKKKTLNFRQFIFSQHLTLLYSGKIYNKLM